MVLYAEVMELVYMYAWGAYAFGLRVRVPSSAFFCIFDFLGEESGSIELINIL